MAFCNTLKFFILLFLVPLLETKERPLSVREILEEISKSLPSFQTANVESTSITTENHEKENFATVLAFDDRDEDIPRIPDAGYSDDSRTGQKNKAQNINIKSGSTSVPNLNDLGNFDSIEVNYPSDVLFSDKSMSTDIDSLTTISDFQYKNSSLSHIDQYKNVSMSENTQAEMDIEEENAIDTQINAIFTTNSLRNFEVTENAANNTKPFTPSSQNDFDSEVIEIPVEEVQEEKAILNRHIRSTARLEGNIIVTELDNFNGTFPINFEQIKQSSHNFLSVEPTLLATENTISEKESLLETQSPVLPTLEFDNETEHHKNRKIVLEPGENVEISVVFTKPSEDDKIVSVLPTPFNKSVTDDLSTTEKYFSQTPTVSSKRKTKVNVFDTPLNLADSMENSDMSVSSHEVLLKTSSKIKESFVITAKNNMIFFKEKRFDPAHRHRKYFHNTNNRIYRKTLNLKKNNHPSVNKTEQNEPLKMTGLNGEPVVNTNDRIYRKTLIVKENNLNATEAPLNRSRGVELLSTRGLVGNNRLECINCSRKDANASCVNCTTTTTSTSDFYFNDSPDGGGYVIRNQRHAQIEDFGGTFTGAGGKKKINLFEELKQKINAEKQLEANMSAHGEHKTVSMLNYFVSDALQQPEQGPLSAQAPGPHAWAPVDPGPPPPVRAGVYCAFEKPCDWTWASSFRIVTAADLNSVNVGPKFDASNDTKGHFLFLQVGAGQTFHIASPTLAPSGDACRLELSLHQGNMNASTIKVVGAVGETQWVVSEIFGNSHKSWQRYKFKIGRVSQEFRLIIELIPHLTPAHVALDELRMVDCYPEPARQNRCAVPSQFRCAISNVCINATQVCDIAVDCAHAEDELQDCDKMPFGARCDFEDDWCGWQNDHTRLIQWTRHFVPTVPQTNHSGPSTDHTFLNKSGHYLIVNMAQSVEKKVAFASAAVLYSVVFNPPPPLHSNENSKYYNSCTIRFYYNHNGFHKSGLALMITELKPKENVTTEIWWSFSENKDKWIRGVVTLPNITHRYFLQFTAKKGLRFMSTIAIDDVSLSPECFGLNMPVSELAGYNYWNPQQFVDPTFKETHKGFINKTYYEFTTCGATGRFGPTQHNCTEAYNNTPVDVEVLQKSAFRGIQKWTVPGDGYYTLIAKGASGGRGSGGMGSSRGAVVRTILELRKGEKLYILVGQEGMSACVKILGKISNESCQTMDDTRNLTGVRAVLNMMIRDGGGGGGGATYVFLVQRKNNMSVLVPLLVAAGGGGIGHGRFTDSPQQHGQAVNMSKTPYNGFTKGGDQSAGAGGGWKTDSHRMLTSESGKSLADGGAGGEACYKSRRGEGSGGFGGGGGGCIVGGAGGGYAGGNAHHSNTTNGDGGTSFYTSTGAVSMYGAAWGALHTGSGALLIIPEASGCGCDYRCLALDEHRARVTCICPPDWFLGANNETCMLKEVPNSHGFLIGTLIVIIIIFIIALGALFFMLYNRYQHNKTVILRRKMMSGPELQLNRLRMQSDSIMTEYNPNYEFGGVIYTLKDLQDIPRDQLRLVKALGQGAFGEVYQGFYKARQSDAVEMPVAVKTLPEMSTQQAEMDFLMEALIMSKFNHPNIVHFIGVCFDKHPRFIVLELLAGGDLKNFLRESRPKPERSSPLTMKDLILIAIDVGKGCKYMEDNRFIHRDIAARNCLLTTKGPGRVVKIADFGMSRDIYRSDYYRKGGKAMLPIKWMPPEAFLDGLFTSKTDVWSFGVLLWEIMSMGYMPYTGCANRQVMSLVTSGGRLEPPSSCPGPIYGIMTQCWHPNSEQRPSFAQLLERLGYCLQDPDVVNNPLPVFTKAPSAERDATVMRPKNTDDSCLQVPQNADYLVPTPSAGCDLLVAPHDGSVEKLLSDNGSADSWETSFMLPQSKSTQPLLENNVVDNTNLHEPEVQNLINMDTPQLTPTSTQASDTSLLNHVSYNHNNNVKPLTTTTTNSNLKSGVSLDASILLQQDKRKKPYANVVTTSETGFVNGPYAIDNGAADGFKKPAAGYLNNDSEINC